MKILKSCLLALMVLTLTGCSWCEVEVIKYVDRPVEIMIETKCEIPEVNCKTLNGSIANKLGQTMECVVDLRQSIKVCQ